MFRLNAISAACAATIAVSISNASAQSTDHLRLHVSDRWKECSFQLDPALTQEAWRQFAREVGFVAYIRPLRDAAPLGAGKFEISAVQSVVGIDDRDAAWNDTFVHPDSTHWLFEGGGLPLPGLMGRVGVTDRVDLGFYFTMNPSANYRIAAGQLQYNFLQQAETGLDLSARMNVTTLFGPEDVDVRVAGLDLVASRAFPLFSQVSIAPYASVSGFLSHTHEKSAVVSLQDERVVGAHAMVGALVEISILRVAAEYDAGSVQSRTLRVGVEF